MMAIPAERVDNTRHPQNLKEHQFSIKIAMSNTFVDFDFVDQKFDD